MRIKLHEIPVSEVVDGYLDSAENGVVGYGGRLKRFLLLVRLHPHNSE